MSCRRAPALKRRQWRDPMAKNFSACTGQPPYWLICVVCALLLLQHIYFVDVAEMAVFTCCLSFAFSDVLYWHILHAWSFIPKCMFFSWSRRCTFWEKLFQHSLQPCSLIISCIAFICRFKVRLLDKSFWHTSHWNDFEPCFVVDMVGVLKDTQQ